MAVEGGMAAMENLIAKRRHVPTPDGRTPQINSLPTAPSFILLAELTT